MRFVLRLLLVCTLCCGVALGGDFVPSCDLVDGWTQKGEIEEFVPDNLFDYMNGNAEGYIIFGFEKLTSLRCVSGSNSIVIDVSEMESPEMAYGIFASNQHPRHELLPIGMVGQVLPRRGTFAKGSAFVELTASGDRDQTKSLSAFAKAIEKEMTGTTELPSALRWFPQAGLKVNSIRLVPQSVLGLSMLEQGYVAEYDFGRAFVVFEESPEAAVKTADKLRQRLNDVQPSDVGDKSFKGVDKYLGQMFVVRVGQKIVGFANLKDGVDGRAKTGELVAALPK
jgi:hypothetical protein